MRERSTEILVAIVILVLAVENDVQADTQHKVAIIGSGNWGSAIGKIAARNAARSARIQTEVRMWVFEEDIDGHNLTSLINERHQNQKYLPGHTLPGNLVADPDIVSAVANATILIFVVPSPFLNAAVRDLHGHVRQDAIAVSLIKGMCFNDRGEPELTSVILRDALNISCTGVLMGGNIAADVADAHPCESTLAMDCNCSEEAVACVSEVFRTDAFAIQVISDVMGAELCGALKNVIALGAGFCDGLGLSPSTKAAVVRRGLNEMRGVVKMLHPAAQDDLFFESCGVGDVLATCYSPHGRNRRCAEAFAQNGGRASWEQIERNMLNGQKLQGVRTAVGLALCLKQKECAGRFPLLCRIHAIAIEGAPVESISKWV